MEAKDTVMTEDKLVALPHYDRNTVLLAQAKLSFKAGRELGYRQGLAMKPNPDGVYKNGLRDGKLAGIREVVEWIPQLINRIKEAMWNDDWGIKGVIYPEQLDGIVTEALQAFLKGKEIEEAK